MLGNHFILTDNAKIVIICMKTRHVLTLGGFWTVKLSCVITIVIRINVRNVTSTAVAILGARTYYKWTFKNRHVKCNHALVTIIKSVEVFYTCFSTLIPSFYRQFYKGSAVYEI